MEQPASPRTIHQRRWVVRARHPMQSRRRFQLHQEARCLWSKAERSRTMRCSSWSAWAWKTEHRWRSDSLHTDLNKDHQVHLIPLSDESETARVRDIWITSTAQLTIKGTRAYFHEPAHQSDPLEFLRVEGNTIWRGSIDLARWGLGGRRPSLHLISMVRVARKSCVQS